MDSPTPPILFFHVVSFCSFLFCPLLAIGTPFSLFLRWTGMAFSGAAWWWALVFLLLGSILRRVLFLSKGFWGGPPPPPPPHTEGPRFLLAVAPYSSVCPFSSPLHTPSFSPSDFSDKSTPFCWLGEMTFLIKTAFSTPEQFYLCGEGFFFFLTWAGTDFFSFVLIKVFDFSFLVSIRLPSNRPFSYFHWPSCAAR